MAGTVVVDAVKSSTTGAPTFQNTSGTEVGQLCRAWVNFNGSTGTRNASFNISSVVRNGTGDYSIYFANAMIDANYSAAGIGRRNTAGTNITQLEFAANTTSLQNTMCQIKTFDNNNTAVDSDTVCVAIFR